MFIMYIDSSACSFFNGLLSCCGSFVSRVFILQHLSTALEKSGMLFFQIFPGIPFFSALKLYYELIDFRPSFLQNFVFYKYDQYYNFIQGAKMILGKMKDIDGYYDRLKSKLSNFSGQFKKRITNCFSFQIVCFTDCGSQRSIPISDGSSFCCC